MMYAPQLPGYDRRDPSLRWHRLLKFVLYGLVVERLLALVTIEAGFKDVRVTVVVDALRVGTMKCSFVASPMPSSVSSSLSSVVITAPNLQSTFSASSQILRAFEGREGRGQSDSV